ncbi:hypothetical protein RRG08_035096 [Elysia crispata]|uniref:Uncharacterized protein n=1 Tax=Elysia crispata TaxID=231223 RepID=A0AAE0ZS96_9GAST|nr:hypothetical protein RRG08_035096 [Elysia crispata]
MDEGQDHTEPRGTQRLYRRRSGVVKEAREKWVKDAEQGECRRASKMTVEGAKTDRWVGVATGDSNGTQFMKEKREESPAASSFVQQSSIYKDTRASGLFCKYSESLLTIL